MAITYALKRNGPHEVRYYPSVGFAAYDTRRGNNGVVASFDTYAEARHRCGQLDDDYFRSSDPELLGYEVTRGEAYTPDMEPDIIAKIQGKYSNFEAFDYALESAVYAVLNCLP